MSYTTITIEGGFFPSDLLDRIASNPQDVPGQSPKDFGLTGKRLTDEIQSLFSDAQSYWTAFRRRYERAKSGRNQSLTTVTREGWLDPLLGGFGYKLNFQRTAAEAGGDNFAISHRAGDDPTAPPVHIVGYDEELDSRKAGRRSPHATVQEYLNRSDVLWGIVTNGRSLRLLRNSARLSKPTYLEFDLEGMIEGNVYSEFVLFYRLLHRTRLPHSVADGSDCILEKYYQDGIEQGGRVRERLRDGVEAALKTLGNAFIVHPRSDALRAALAEGTLKASEYYRELLRLVYRMLFLMVAEERKLLFPDSREHQERRAVFLEHYGIGQLRFRAERRTFSDAEIDLWEGLKRTFRILREDRIAKQLGMAALNGELFGPHGCPQIEDAYCKNDSLLTAIDSLSRFDDDGTRRRVNFGALDVEELGSVYESLLEFHPVISANAAGFDLIAGSERKTTGSYYTPPELVHELIESALAPVMKERLEAAKTKDDKIATLLALRVIDPAAGSGHFMLAAARRVGKELARIRSGEEEPAPTEYRHAVRDVIRECIYAVDKNQLAVDLCKVALWIEGHNAGQPLSFLDHHVKCGDSLVGVFDLKVLEAGIPDEAYKAVTGDDKDAAKHYRKLNRETRANQPTLPLIAPPRELTAAFEALSHRDEASPADVEKKAADYAELRHRPEIARLENACNAWNAAFFVPLRMPQYRGQDLVPTTAMLWELLNGRQIYGRLTQEITRAATTYSFFNWPLEFPEVFARNGFDVVLGNPPWERIKLQEKEFFAIHDRKIANSANKAEREKLIKNLEKLNPELWDAWQTALHGAEGQSKFVRDGERFPLCGRGDVNTYSIFAELAHKLAGGSGRVGIIVPSGIATDDTTKFFFRDLMESRALASLYSFENEERIFPAVHHAMKFCLLTMTGSGRADSADLFFFARRLDALRDDQRHFSLTAADLTLLNPNTRTSPIFRTKRDAEITKAIYRRLPVLIKDGSPAENSWGVQFAAMFHMSNDSHLFRTREQLESNDWKLDSNIFRKDNDRYLPLYEAKMIHQFDHRFASVEVDERRRFRQGQPDKTEIVELQEPDFYVTPHYFVDETTVEGAVPQGYHASWFVGFERITAVTNERTFISTILPTAGVGDSIFLCLLPQNHETPSLGAVLVGIFNAFVFDFVVRQKLGGLNLNYFVVRQLPVPLSNIYTEACSWEQSEPLSRWILPRVLELTFTAWDLASFATELGHEGPPFRWDEERRFLIRCELDAAFFHLYDVSRDDTEYIMETFSIVKRKDEARFSEYRTKCVILEIYDKMERAKETGVPYLTRLDPPPGDPRAAHKQSEIKPITKDSSLSSEE